MMEYHSNQTMQRTYTFDTYCNELRLYIFFLDINPEMN